jgi:hypothetical protein
MIDLLRERESTKRQFSSGEQSWRAAKRTEIFGEKDHAECVYAEGDNFRDDHVNVPFVQRKINVMKRVAQGWEKQREGGRTYQIVISNATMISSLRINAVNEMATMFKNSFSNRTRAMIMIAAPREKKRGVGVGPFFVMTKTRG